MLINGKHLIKSYALYLFCAKSVKGHSVPSGPAQKKVFVRATKIEKFFQKINSSEKKIKYGFIKNERY